MAPDKWRVNVLFPIFPRCLSLTAVLSLLAKAGYQGRKRGEVVRTRTTILQTHTHQLMGTYGGPGNGDYRGELTRACLVALSYAAKHHLAASQILIRLDGEYGNAAVVIQVLSTGLGLIGRCRDYGLLDRAEVLAVLAQLPVARSTHAESGMVRDLYDCPEVFLRGPAGPHVRLIVATHPATGTAHRIGTKRDGIVYELFVTTLTAPAFSTTDVLDLYLHRGSFETVLADEDVEQDLDRWCSHTPCGQEFWQIIGQWVWNFRLELGQHLSPTPPRTTEFSPANEPEVASEPEVANEPEVASEPEAVVYGPPQWAHRSFTGGFPGSAFTQQPDSTLLCPAGHTLYPQERRPERDGSLRVLYAARIGDCRTCLLRARCQENLLTIKPRRVSAVYWPLSPPPDPVSVPVYGPPQPPACLPVLWRDWPRCQIRRHWIKIVHSQRVEVMVGTLPEAPIHLAAPEPIFTRPQRAHWRLSWAQRLASNARPDTAPPVTVTLHGLPASFAKTYGFDLLNVA